MILRSKRRQRNLTLFRSAVTTRLAAIDSGSVFRLFSQLPSSPSTTTTSPSFSSTLRECRTRIT